MNGLNRRFSELATEDAAAAPEPGRRLCDIPARDVGEPPDDGILGWPWTWDETRRRPQDASERWTDAFALDQRLHGNFADAQRRHENPRPVGDSPPVKILCPSASKPKPKETWPLDEWYLEVDPELYDQCWTVYTAEFLELDSAKRPRSPDSPRARKKRPNSASL